LNSTSDHERALVAGMAWAYGREHIHDAGMTPLAGDIRYIEGMEYVFDGLHWRRSEKAVSGTPSPTARLETDPRHFSHAKFDALVEETVAKIKSLGQFKGGEYAGDDDRLANFRRNGLALGLPMEAIWAVYYNKHHDAVMQFIKDNNNGKTRKRLEPIDGRVDDMILYLILFKAMLHETNNS
jgi:hypothetical protein